MTYKRGMVISVDLGINCGSEVNKKRPCVVVQNDMGNKHSPTLIVLAISHRNATLPTQVELKRWMMTGSNRVDGIVMAEQIRTIDKKRVDYIYGSLNDEAMKLIDEALFTSLGLLY